MSEDMTLEMMVSSGYVEKIPGKKDLWRMTEKGRTAFEALCRKNPELMAAEFPDWVKIDWVH